MALLWLLPLTFLLYFFIFKFFIVKFNLKTPGRGDDEDISFMTKKKYNELKEGESAEDALEARVVEALGGASNIESISACATRLRVNVKDLSVVASDDAWKNYLEALGVVRSGNSLQVIYGVRVTSLLTKIKDLLHLD